MNRRQRAARLVALAAAGALAAGCGQSATSNKPAAARPSATPSAAPSAPADGVPHGIIALGHSALTAEGTNESQPDRPALLNSWATGTNPAVNSIYLRMLALDPDSRDRIGNTARGGAKADALPDQATSALALVPNPRLVIIQTIDNDITCDGTDPQNYAVVGQAVKEALVELVKAAPRTKILVVSQRGRPLEAAVALAKSPGAVIANQGDGPCDLYDLHGRVARVHIAHLTTIIEGYEAALKQVCATVPQCHFDNGVNTTWQDRPEDYLPDWNHLNLHGQASAAALMWPTVAALLRS